MLLFWSCGKKKKNKVLSTAVYSAKRVGIWGSLVKFGEWFVLKIICECSLSKCYFKVFIWFQTCFIMFKAWFDDYDID